MSLKTERLVMHSVDDFLPEAEAKYWAERDPANYEMLMSRYGPGAPEDEMLAKCREAAAQLLPGVQLVRQVYWPRMNQLPIGTEKALHVDPKIISCVYHCSPVWEPGDGGALLLELDDAAPEFWNRIEYRPNRLVIFDASVPHLVEAARRVRNTALVPFLGGEGW